MGMTKQEKALIKAYVTFRESQYNLTYNTEHSLEIEICTIMGKINNCKYREIVTNYIKTLLK